MFTPNKNKVAEWNMNVLSNTALSPGRKVLVTKNSLFKKERETVLVFGGIDPHNDYGVGRNTGKNILRYVPDENIWEFVGELPEPRHHHCVQFFKARIYLVGGADPRQDDLTMKSMIVAKTWSFDPSTKSWFSEPNLQVARKNFGLVACNQSLYAIGGQGKDYQALKSLEQFNMKEKMWEEKAPMIHARIGLACAKYRNYIWVAGGLSGSNKQRTVLDSVESYNLRSNQWTEIDHPLRFPKCFSCMFVMSDQLYIIGGAGKTSERDKSTTSVGDIDMWDGHKLEWRNVTEMHIPRHGHSVAYLGTQILITGGVTTTYRRALSNTECFCSQRGTWVRGLACLPTGLSGHAAITLPPASLLA